MKSFILRTDKDLSRAKAVTNLFSDERIILSLPNRVSITLIRIRKEIIIECDLGLIGSDIDLKEICRIDISKEDYESAISFSEDFLKDTRSFENNFGIGKFVKARTNPHSGVHAGCFGSWNDQVYIHLAQPTYKRIANIEFSVLEEKQIELYGEQYDLTEPMYTLVASLQLHNQRPHYFFFVEWNGNEFWQYGKNFFFNNTSFFRKKFKKKQEIVLSKYYSYQ
mgnify:CR=1 FL=1